jgi:tetratricopeptide (TPR) repeat protein
VIRISALAAALLLAGATHGAAAAPPDGGAKWTMVRTAAMTVIGDQPAEALRDVAIQIEQFRTVVGGLIPNAGHPPSLPTIVFVFGTRKAMQPFLPVANGRTADVAGYFQRSSDVNHIVLSLEGFEESTSVVYHEYTHLLLVSAVRSVPIWLNEGLAEYYSSYTLSRDARTAVIGRVIDWRVEMLREKWLPLADVLVIDSATALHDASQRRSLFYSEAWALTHYLLTQVPDGAAKINRYVVAVAEGQSPSEAFVDAFGATPADFDRQLKTYIRQPAFTATRFTFKDRIQVDAPGPPRSLTATEVDAWLGDLQRRIDRRSEAVGRIETAAAVQPDSAPAQLSLGLLRIDEGRTDEGIGALERARSLAPDDFVIQYLHGVSLLKLDEVGNRRHTAAALLSLQRAVALRRDSPDAIAWLAFAQMLDDKTLPDARESIQRAIELAPGRLDYRLRLADVSILQGDFDEARALLTALARVPFDQAAAGAAKARLDALARYDSRQPVRGTAQVQATGQGRGAVPVEVGALSPASTPSASPRLRLRPTQLGEVRTEGALLRIDCGATGVRLTVQVADSTLVTGAVSMEKVELISYLDDKNFSIACGMRKPPDRVYLTWRPDVQTNTRIAIALEFLPADFTP